MGMKANEVGRKAVKAANSIVNFTVLVIIIILLAFAGYALWDSKQIYQAADKSSYAIYKPSAADEGKSFQELQAINAEVFAWLNVYGTNIDYPVTQSQDNVKYVNTNAEGLYSLAGSIFLDYNNSSDFSDFNHILYGHHMEKKAMFGEIGDFVDVEMFESHRYGNLYFDGRDHGIEFFMFFHTDAYDTDTFTANVKEDAKQEYLDTLLSKAMYKREFGISTDDHIVLLSTCSSSSTNGRDLLVGRITDETYTDQFVISESNDRNNGQRVDSQGGLIRVIPQWLQMLILAEIALTSLILIIYHKLKRRKRGGKYE